MFSLKKPSIWFLTFQERSQAEKFIQNRNLNCDLAFTSKIWFNKQLDFYQQSKVNEKPRYSELLDFVKDKPNSTIIDFGGGVDGSEI